MPVGDISDPCRCVICGPAHTEAYCMYVKCRCCAHLLTKKSIHDREAKLDELLNNWNS